MKYRYLQNELQKHLLFHAKEFSSLRTNNVAQNVTFIVNSSKVLKRLTRAVCALRFYSVVLVSDSILLETSMMT